METILNAELEEKDIPLPNADWNVISHFALTFNGYDYWCSPEKCGEIANNWAKAWKKKKLLPDSLTVLRTCLFFEQRRWRHFGCDPDDDTMVYIHALVEAIRNKIQKGERD